MKIDPTVDRIRKVRHAISVQCDHNPRKSVDYYMKYQEKYERAVDDVTEGHNSKRLIIQRQRKSPHGLTEMYHRTGGVVCGVCPPY
ncbi:MAG: hypothetical protein SD837_02035 [Candidatus Electrothrix scaldis]|nr:MAG: hypothetical protein SD837_02035 [Candidatus Electrothrix sp. GW3-3]